MTKRGRRDFVAGAGLALAGAFAAGFPAPTVVAAEPTLKWRLVSAFPKRLDILFAAATDIADRVAAATDGKFQVRAFAAGEIVPTFQVLDAVGAGTVELGHGPSYFYVGKDPTFAFDTAVPFGLNTRQQNAWMYRGGGLELLRAFFKGYNIVQFPAGNSGTQMGGWFSKEITTVDDLRGLRFRIPGLAGQVLARLGVVPQQIPPGDIYPALEKGTIDAAEFVGPYDDEKLGFNKVARFYYYPGWWEGCAQGSLYVNADQWAALPKSYQAILAAAAAEANLIMPARYDAMNPPALKRLVGSGTQLKPFSREIMTACYEAAFALYDEIAARNDGFRQIYESWKPFRADEYLWFRVAENTFDNFVYAQQAAGK